MNISGNVYAQTVIYSQNFNTGGSDWNLNTPDAGSVAGTSGNSWRIDNLYAGNFFCNQTPSQPGTITGSPQSTYMHIGTQLAPHACFLAPATGNKFTSMNNSLNTVGFTNVTLRFFYICNGGGANYFGRLYYSLDGGNTWTIKDTYSGVSNWIQATVTDPAFDNAPNLRFGFMWVQQGGSIASDPSFGVDEFVVTGITSACNLALSSPTTTNPSCAGTNTGSISIGSSGGVGVLSYILTPTGGSSISNNNGVFNALPAGNYTIIVRDANNCADTITGIILSDPLPILPPSVSNSGPVCDGNPVNLSANAVPNATYTWTGPGNFSSNLQNPTVAPALAGTYSLIINIAGCNSAPATTTVVVNPFNPPPIIAGPDTTVCQGAPVEITASGAVSYLWDNNNSTSPTQTVTPAATTTYTVTGTGSDGCVASAQVTINVAPNNLVLTVNITQPECPGQTGTIQGNLANGTPPFVFTLDGQQNSTGIFPNLSAGFYSLSVNDANGCGLSTSGLPIDSLPTPELALSAADLTCFNQTPPTGIIIVQGGSAGYLYGIQGTTLTPDSIIQGLPAGLYNVEIRDENNCSYLITTQINQPDEVTLTISPETANIQPGQTFNASVSFPPGSNPDLLWTAIPPTELSCTTCPTPSLSPLVNTTLIVQDQVCLSTDTLVILVNADIKIAIPTAFTPNQDGKNDIFKAFTNIPLENYTLKIFNRWGNLVFETNDIIVGWNGEYKAEPQPIGTYVYVIEYRVSGDLDAKLLKGNVSLIR